MNTLRLARELERRYIEAGLEPSRLRLHDAWEIFRAYLRRADRDSAGLAAVVCTHFRGDDGGRCFMIQFMRQFGADQPVRATFVEFAFDAEPFLRVPAGEAWSSDNVDLAAFGRAVEALPAFRAALDQVPLLTRVYDREL